jgi:hypothetical protein
MSYVLLVTAVNIKARRAPLVEQPTLTDSFGYRQVLGSTPSVGFLFPIFFGSLLWPFGITLMMLHAHS